MAKNSRKITIDLDDSADADVFIHILRDDFIVAQIRVQAEIDAGNDMVLDGAISVWGPRTPFRHPAEYVLELPAPMQKTNRKSGEENPT